MNNCLLCKKETTKKFCSNSCRKKYYRNHIKMYVSDFFYGLFSELKSHLLDVWKFMKSFTKPTGMIFLLVLLSLFVYDYTFLGHKGIYTSVLLVLALAYLIIQETKGKGYVGRYRQRNGIPTKRSIKKMKEQYKNGK